jgi:hypothetical protein
LILNNTVNGELFLKEVPFAVTSVILTKFWSNIERQQNNFGTKWFQLESIKLYLILR